MSGGAAAPPGTVVDPRPLPARRLLGAVVPLALIGVWLTRSVVRAGEDLLHSELDQSLRNVADVVEQRWSYRHGDLALLAANDVAQRLLAAGSAQPLVGD